MVIVTTVFELLNVAVTEVAAVTVTTQVSVPLHAPLHPANTEPPDGVAVNVTCVPLAKLPEQPSGQSIPSGELVTFPLPVPASFTVNTKFIEVPAVKFATTVVACVIVTVQVPVPSHGPAPQPANVDPFVGVAVRVTSVPLVKFAVHVDGQEIPAGELVTVPVPVPPSVTVSPTVVADVPVPVKATSCGLFGAESVNVKFVEYAIALVGVKVTITVHEAPAAIGAAVQFVVSAKPVPTTTLGIVTVVVPVLVNVTVCAALVVLIA
jgi:hypothetical protein